ncbi:hypothetical protein FJ872_25765 [Mesorhizobium sp. B2-5-9]|uniref:P-loop ATPase, Sll1717 family n=1 Tax=Mesorhizobium sp. B2-5-9 TaxID=2589921 RepID=UPI001125E1D4|nr:hypothetical protein [Mesorhizobium sp. B2-5-9]TPK05696.1 hypothetical protein FJ872_25765 [Mesorhizobium sp. B2-5-9]
MSVRNDEPYSVGSINFGSIEAKHDLIGASETSQRQFEESFVRPQSLSYADFIGGSKFLVYGVKGTGKTALLHYLSIQAKKIGVDSKFLLFSKDITEDDRKNLSKAAGFSITEYRPRQIEQDFEAVWLWYFHRHIAQTLSDSEWPSASLQQYLKYVEYISGDKENSWKTKLWRLLPSFRNGKIEIKGKLPPVEAGISGEFEKRGQIHEISLTKAAERANDLLEDIGNLGVEHLIFVDELELTLSNSVDFVRDGRTISGLIRAAAHINEIMRSTGSKIKIICAVRSEVLRSSHVSGDEINKIVFDFGVPIRWNYAFDDDNHPLLKVIENRVVTSLRTQDTNFISGQVWSQLFPKTIQDKRIKNWILDRTWYRPRDVVRLLTICRNFDPSAALFSQNAFEQTAREYSDSCWTEIAEELRASYSTEAVEAVKLMFTSLPNRPMTVSQIQDAFVTKSRAYPAISDLLKTKPFSDLLEDFFRVGILGNEHKLKSKDGTRFLHNWYFRNGDNLLFDKDVSVHRGLRHTFRMVTR